MGFPRVPNVPAALPLYILSRDERVRSAPGDDNRIKRKGCATKWYDHAPCVLREMRGCDAYLDHNWDFPSRTAGSWSGGGITRWIWPSGFESANCFVTPREVAMRACSVSGIGVHWQKIHRNADVLRTNADVGPSGWSRTRFHPVRCHPFAV
jgi:hypothetical protein